MSLEKKIRKLEHKMNLLHFNPIISDLWRNIATYEEKERRHESSNGLLSEARAGARMEVYITIMERKLNE